VVFCSYLFNNYKVIERRVKMKKRFILQLSVILFCLTMITFPVSAKNETSTLNVAVQSDTEALDPAQCHWLGSLLALGPLYDTLITFKDDTSELAPSLAEKWEVSEDGKAITFHLRKGVKFHNGEELTAEDIQYSLKRLFNTNLGPSAQKLRAVTTKDSFIAKGKYTFVLKLKTATPRIFASLTTPLGSGIVSKSVVEKHATEGDPYALNWMRDHAVGSGPWKLEKWSVKEKIILKRNDEYWGEKPYFDRLVINFISEPTTAQMMLEKGDIDITLDLTMDQFSSLEKLDNVKVVSNTTLKTVYIHMNCQRKPFSDIRVRKALNQAINHEEIIKYTELGMASRLYGIIPKGMTGWDPDIESKYEYNPTKVKAILKEAGYPNGFNTTLICAVERHLPFEAMLPYLISYFNDVGINLKAQKMAFSTQLGKMKKRDYDLALFTWNPYDPTAVPIYYYNSEMWKKRGGWSFAFWDNKKFDDLLINGWDNMNLEEREQQFLKADSIAVNNAINIPLCQLKKGIAMRKDINGVEWHPTLWYKKFNKVYRQE